MKNFILFALIFCSLNSYAQLYKSMMDDRGVNIYEVVEEAERYFSDKDKFAKGSGWKGYQRWLSKVEPMYAPSGDRLSVDPRFAQKGYNNFIKKFPPKESRDAEGWQDLGPYNINNITGHYSPGLGRVEHVWIHPTDDNMMYLSSRSGGFWKSTDGGESWVNTTDGLPSSGVDVFAVNPSDYNDILINVRNAGNGVTMGIYRSLDGGNSWNITSFNPDDTGIGGLGTNETVSDIKFNPHDNSEIFIAASGFMFRSTDNMATVATVSNNSYASITFHETNPNIIFAPRSYYWSRDEVWRSLDGGSTWSLLHDISLNNYRTLTVATTPDNPNLVLFASGTHIWKSTDNGISIDTISGSAGMGNYFAVSDIDDDIFVSGGIDIRISEDGGSNWNTVTDWYWPGGGAPPADYVHADLRYSEFQNGALICGTDGFMVRSMDIGQNWEILSDGTGIRENYRLGVSQSNEDIVVCGSQDNGTSIYQGQGMDWIEWIGADGMEGLVHPLDSKRMVGSIQNGNKRRSLDGGYTTGGINNHPNIGSRNWIAPVFYDPIDHMKLYTVGQMVHSSDNFGTQWDELHEFDEGSFQHLVKSEINGDIMLASKSEKLYRSIDQGATFTQVGASDLPNKGIQDIVFDPTNDNNVLIVYAHHQDDGARIFRSTNGGINWTNITYNLSNIPARSAAIDHTDLKNIYIGTETGVFIMPWGDTEYEIWSSELPPVAIYELEIMYGTNTIRAASWGRGLWERKLQGCSEYPEITHVDIDAAISETSPTNNQNVKLIITLTDADDVENAYMKYSFNGYGLENQIDLIRFNKNQYILDGLMPIGSVDDKLYFKIFVENTSGNVTESYRFMYTLRAEVDICTAEGSSGTGSDYINYVSLNGTTNTSGQDFYGDFTGTSFNVNTYQTYTLEVGLAAVFDADTLFAWVDWDNSKTFENDELITFTEFNNDNKAFANVTVPGDVNPDLSPILRIRNQWSNNTPNPCGSGISGEVEDYSLKVSDGCASGNEVINLNNQDAGSLRFLIEETCIGDTIFISQNLLGDTLHVYNQHILLNKDVVIMGLTNSDFVLSGDLKRRIFMISESTDVSLHEMKMIDSTEDPNGGAIYNQGNLILTNMYFENNLEGGTPKSLTNSGPGLLTIKSGATQLKN